MANRSMPVAGGGQLKRVVSVPIPLQKFSGETVMNRTPHSGQSRGRQEACRQVAEKRFAGVNRFC